MTQRRSTPGVDAHDLVIRSRRGELLAEEQALLERALQASASLRISHQMGRDFDDAQRVQAGDDALIARATERALRGRTRRWRTRQHRSWWLAAAAAFVALGAAASVMIVEPQPMQKRAAPGRSPAPASKNTEPSEPRGASAAQASPKRAPTPVETATEATSTTASKQPPAEKRAQPTPRSDSSAAELFREANAKRRVGDLQSASALYSALQAKFPGTNEARVSHVSLGKLHLGAGRAREADRQFRLYLAAGGGHLNEEALVGRAEALSRLGEMDAERRVWQRLQTSHPASVYRAHARKRLEALDALARSQSR